MFGQGFEGLIVEEIPVSAAAIASDPYGNLNANSVTYRIFVDMADGYEFQAVLGASLNPIVATTTTQWYNDADMGAVLPLGFAFRTHPTMDDPQYYDSWITLGAYGDLSRTTSAAQIVPIALDTDGTPDGFVLATPEVTPTHDSYPYEDHFGYDMGTDMNTENAIWYVEGGVQGITSGNIVCLGQFTTDGYVTFELPVQLRVRGTSTVENWVYRQAFTTTHIQSNDIFWTNVPDEAPELTSFTTDASVYDKGETAVLTATATDDNEVDRVDFYANGSLIFSDNEAPYTTNWNVVGTSANLMAIVFDNIGQSDTSDIISVTINDPNPTVVSITSPVAGTYNLNALTITVTAEDLDEPVQSVTFSAGASVIGVDNNGTDGWSVVWTPSEGSFNLSATAENSEGISTTSDIVPVVIENSLPTVSITSPAAGGFDLEIGMDTTIVAAASDIDGTITGVQFIVNGIVASTDVTAPYEYVYSASALGSVSIVARATDNAGGITSSTALPFTVVAPVGGPVAQIQSVVDYCSSSDVFALPILTTGAVSDILGYDIDLQYDPAMVTPTGLVVSGEDLIADQDYVTAYKSYPSTNIMRIELTINSTAPAGTVFEGDANDVICYVYFSRNVSFGSTASTTFALPEVAESYAAYTNFSTGYEGTYSTITETEFVGTLSFWSDNSPIAYVAGTNAITEIVSVSAPAYSVNPDASGEFVFNIATGGTQISIERDVDNAFNIQPVIGGQDAYLTSRVSLGDASYSPNIYQILAMDVNRDGSVTAGDITQIQQRSVGNIGEFAQQGSGTTDWLFVAFNTVLTDLSYRISETYPNADGIGYDRRNVPSVADIIDLPVENASTCPIISDENYKGILLGDVTGNYAAQPDSPQLKSAGSKGLNIEIAELGDNSYQMRVVASYSDNINSYDLRLGFENNVNVNELSNKNGFNASYTSTGVDYIALSGYTTSTSFKDGEVAYVTFASSSPLTINNIDVITSIINETSVTSQISASSATEVNALSSLDINVYPVPASREFTVEVPESGTVQITDLSGRAVTIEQVVNANEINTINIENLASGIYLMKVQINGMVAIKKIEVSK